LEPLRGQLVRLGRFINICRPGARPLPKALVHMMHAERERAVFGRNVCKLRRERTAAGVYFAADSLARAFLTISAQNVCSADAAAFH